MTNHTTTIAIEVTTAVGRLADICVSMPPKVPRVLAWRRCRIAGRRQGRRPGRLYAFRRAVSRARGTTGEHVAAWMLMAVEVVAMGARLSRATS